MHQKKMQIVLPAARCAKRQAHCALGFIAFSYTISYGKNAFVPPWA